MSLLDGNHSIFIPSSLDSLGVWVNSSCHLKRSLERAESSLAVICVERVRSHLFPVHWGDVEIASQSPTTTKPALPASSTPRERIMRTGRGCTAHHRAACMSKLPLRHVSSPHLCHTGSGPQVVHVIRPTERHSSNADELLGVWCWWLMAYSGHACSSVTVRNAFHERFVTTTSPHRRTPDKTAESRRCRFTRMLERDVALVKWS